MSEWVGWHRRYQPTSSLSRRLEVVREEIRGALDGCPTGPIRVISICAGDGRDLLGVLTDHPRRGDVWGRLVELDPELADDARRRVAELGLEAIEVVCRDAADTDAYSSAAPADLVLACGIFGNVSDEDVRRTVEALPGLCAAGATVIWTRGRFDPDLTPAIRGWFARAGFSEVRFVAIPGGPEAVGTHRLAVSPQPFRPGVHLFQFLPRALRPSERARRGEGRS